MTSREREVPPKSVPSFATVLVGSSGQIPATVTAGAVERYEKPGIIRCGSGLSQQHSSSWAGERILVGLFHFCPLSVVSCSLFLFLEAFAFTVIEALH